MQAFKTKEIEPKLVASEISPSKTIKVYPEELIKNLGKGRLFISRELETVPAEKKVLEFVWNAWGDFEGLCKSGKYITPIKNSDKVSVDAWGLLTDLKDVFMAKLGKHDLNNKEKVRGFLMATKLFTWVFLASQEKDSKRTPFGL